ncbi:hypothetical protein B0H19DRAFT_212741 [Mycena capillaripes]|nr:hypothetical protein B0H19DRAFT_212741 [Mycena capillaripes]
MESGNSAFSALGLEFTPAESKGHDQVYEPSVPKSYPDVNPFSPSEMEDVQFEAQNGILNPVALNKSSAHRRQLAPIELPASFDSPIIPREVFECVVCMADSWETLGCGHSFCQDCLETHVQSKLEARRYPITCLACPANTEYSSGSNWRRCFNSP